MSNIVKVEQGVIVPVDITESEHRALGRALMGEHDHIQEELKRNQWQIGDWYNTIQWGDKRTYCEKLNIDYRYATRCGQVAAKYALGSNNTSMCNLPTRAAELPWTVHMEACKGTDDEQRAELIKQAVIGVDEPPEGKKRFLTVAEVRTKREKMLGVKKELKVNPNTMEQIDEVLETLPKATSAKSKKIINRIVGIMQHDFKKQVEEATAKAVPEERERLEKAKQTALDANSEAVWKSQRLNEMYKNLDALMTREEYKIVLSCLHPDKEASPERKAKAFDIMRNLEEAIPPKDRKNWGKRTPLKSVMGFKPS